MSDLTFPVLSEGGTTSTENRMKKVHGFPFIPLMDASDTYYIHFDSKTKLYPLITCVAGLWKLLVILLDETHIFKS